MGPHVGFILLQASSPRVKVRSRVLLPASTVALPRVAFLPPLLPGHTHPSCPLLSLLSVLVLLFSVRNKGFCSQLLRCVCVCVCACSHVCLLSKIIGKLFQHFLAQFSHL